MEEITRYFQRGEEVICVLRHVVSDFAVSTANAHILSDPSDLTSDPEPGWVEITKGQFEVGRQLLELRRDEIVREIQAEDLANRRGAYDEAISLGFSPKAAATFSGYVPEE